MLTASATQMEDEQDFAAGEDRASLPMRNDTFLGVFEAIGQDLGINPNWLRVPFAALILWNPVAIVGAYLALGAVVAASRWFYPAAAASHAKLREAAVDERANDVSEERLAA